MASTHLCRHWRAVNNVSHDLVFLERRNLYETELSLLADPDYMQNHGADHQPKNYIDQSMRMIVISWLVEVACEYELHQETLFLAAALLDRYMSLAKVLFAHMSFSPAMSTQVFALIRALASVSALVRGVHVSPDLLP